MTINLNEVTHWIELTKVEDEFNCESLFGPLQTTENHTIFVPFVKDKAVKPDSMTDDEFEEYAIMDFDAGEFPASELKENYMSAVASMAYGAPALSMSVSVYSDLLPKIEAESEEAYDDDTGIIYKEVMLFIDVNIPENEPELPKQLPDEDDDVFVERWIDASHWINKLEIKAVEEMIKEVTIPNS